LPPGSPFRISDFTLNLFGKFLCYAILALGIDLIWGFTGVLSLGHGVFFGLGAYAMGMHLMLEIGTQSVYKNALPDFMVWNQVKELPLFWRPFYSGPFTLLAVLSVPAAVAFVFGYLTFRSRIRGVYFSIITQALALSAWLMFNRNSLNLGGTNGLSGFKTVFGFTLNSAATQRGLYVVTALCLCVAYLLCRAITRSPAGKVLVAIRDSETRVLFSGYSPAAFKVFVCVVSAILAGVAGALYVPQVGIITPAKIGVLPSIEMIIWVAVGGRGTLLGPIVGAFGVNWLQSILTTRYPDMWLLVLGGMFVGVVLFFPDGVVGTVQKLIARVSARHRRGAPAAGAAEPERGDAAESAGEAFEAKAVRR
jgi:urea transport system permease protein